MYADAEWRSAKSFCYEIPRLLHWKNSRGHIGKIEASINDCALSRVQEIIC